MKSTEHTLPTGRQGAQSTDKKCVVFDFDGTLVDVEAVILDIYSDLAVSRGWPKMTKRTISSLRTGGARAALDLLGIKLWQLPGLLRLARREYQKRSQEIKFFPGIADTLKKLSNNHDLFILSSNDEHTVQQVLTDNGIKTNIIVMKGSSLFGKDGPLKKLLREGNYLPSECWMVGDEARDIESGKKAGMQTIGVAWGLQGQKGISLAEPTQVAKKPADILKIVGNK